MAANNLLPVFRRIESSIFIPASAPFRTDDISSGTVGPVLSKVGRTERI
jgi:hypothetical protein